MTEIKLCHDGACAAGRGASHFWVSRGHVEA